MIGEFNILIGFPTERDIEPCFQPMRELPVLLRNQRNLNPIRPREINFIKLPVESRWPNLLKEIGAFPSTSQARKNGWNKDIPDGWSEVKIGRRFIFVLKITG